MQNEMPMTTGRWKSKPEVECQYSGRPFSQTGNSYKEAVDWDIVRNLVHLKTLTFWGHAHYQTRTGSCFTTSAATILKILTTLSLCFQWCDSHEIWWANAKWDADDKWCVKIETGSRISIWWPMVIPFPKQEVVITQSWLEISLRNLVHLEIPTFWEHCTAKRRAGATAPVVNVYLNFIAEWIRWQNLIPVALFLTTKIRDNENK